ncbi:glycosyltransferase family 4 protein [Salinisphaera sp. T31B1]|uniref:glycosyltransferase family 4 protein n=1 Tax=Salinisphaera sp. T31B1 TaxID=727963 RepID=UPI003342AB36
MTAMPVHFIVAGDPGQPTGGYVYDARIVEGLRALGFKVTVHGLPGRFPLPDSCATHALANTLDGLADDSCVVIDGLAGGGLADVIEPHAGRLRLIGLVHHPLTDETGLDQRTRELLKASERRTIAAMDHVVVTSQYTAERLTALAMPSAALSVVAPGVEPAQPAPARRAGPLRLLCVAGITQRKGHDVLVEALARTADRSWRLRLVGPLDRSPACTQRLIAQIEAHQLTDRISLSGVLSADDLAYAYQQSDLFVLASHYEGHGMVIDEAIAHGLPVVTTTGGALPLTLPDGCGLAVPPGDAVALADALAELLDNPRQRAACAAESRAAAASQPRWEDAARGFAAVLAEQVGVDA